MSQQLATFEKTNNSLKIIPIIERLEDIKDCKSFEDVIEHQLCNGWSIVPPEDIGALTSGLIISDDVETNDQGKVTKVGTVYWDHRYEVDSALEMLQNGETVTLIGK